MKLYALASMVMLLTASLHGNQTPEYDAARTRFENRRIRYFLYHLAEQSAQFSLSQENKEHYLSVMNEHMAHVQGKLERIQNATSVHAKVGQAIANKHVIKSFIIATGAGIFSAAFLSEFSLIRGQWNGLSNMNAQLHQQICDLHNTIRMRDEQKPMSMLRDAGSKLVAKYAGMMRKHVESEANEISSERQPEITIVASENAQYPVISSFFRIICAVAGAAFSATTALHELYHALSQEEHLIMTIEKDKAVIAMLERM